MDKKQSLCEKYNIPLSFISYDYILQIEVKDIKTLEQIVKILRSGEVGYYPDLLQKAEEHLATLKPNSLLLRFEKSVCDARNMKPEAYETLKKDVSDWCNNVSALDNELQTCDKVSFTPILPEIRQNPDIDANQLCLEVRENKALFIESQDEVKLEQYLQNLMNDENLLINSMEAEKKFLADREKERGNEFYKVGEIKEALLHYSKSIHIYPTLAVYNNRAMTNLKLKNFQHCINDCNAVLTRDPDNMKALFRIALAYSKLGDSAEAIKYFSKALELEPDNKLVQNELGKVLEGNVAEPVKEKKTRILIEEINTTESEDRTESSISNEILDTKCKDSVHLPLTEMNQNDSLLAALDKQGMEEQSVKHNIEKMPDNKAVAIPKGLSSFEFLNRWCNTKKDSLFEFASLLKSFDPDTLPKMMGSELDGTILATFIRTLKSCFLNNDENLHYAALLLNALTSVERFHIVRSFLTEQEREDAVFIIKQLEENSIHVSQEIKNGF